MNTAHYYEPESPLPLSSPWLQVNIDGTVYKPHLVRIRKRSFTAEMIRSLDIKRHGHTHTIYHLVYFLDGSNTILIGDQIIDVRAGQMVAISPDIYHNIVPRDPKACSFLTLMFTYQHEDQLLSIPLEQLLEQLTGVDYEPSSVVDDTRRTLHPFFACLEKEVLEKTDKNLSLVSYCLAGLLNELTGLTASRKRLQTIPEDILAVQQYIVENLEQPITIHDLAKVSHLSRSHLIGKFKQYCGTSPIDFLINERIQKAKTYLLHSSKRVKEIALLCGFQSEYYFCKTFKKRTKLTPGTFRRNSMETD